MSHPFQAGSDKYYASIVQIVLPYPSLEELPAGLVTLHRVVARAGDGDRADRRP